MTRRELLGLLPGAAVAQLIRPRPALHNFLLWDTFTGPDGTALASHKMDKGPGWTMEVGSCQLQGGQAVPIGSTRITAEAGAADIDVSVTVTFSAIGSGGGGIVFRGQDASNYLRAYINGSGSLSLIETVAGSGNTLMINTVPLQTGMSYQLRLRAVGSLLSLFLNGSHGMSMSTTRFQTGTRCGLSAGSANNCTFDDFQVLRWAMSPLPTLPTVTASNAASPLIIDTYDGSGQVVHPSVIDFGGSGWQGPRYWMSIDPYPGSQAAYENPCIYYSHDGNTWTVPPGLTNPIDPRPSPYYNSDSELILGPDGLLYCFFRRYASNQWDQLLYRTSSDGVTWSSAVVLTPQGLPYQYLSPTIVYRDGSWQMWVVDTSDTVSGAYRLMLYTAPTVAGMGSAPPTFCPMANWRSGYSPMPWHQKIIFYNGLYRGVFTTMVTAGQYSLCYGESADGLDWNVAAAPFLSPGAPGYWDDTWIYRSTFVPISGGYDLWYSAKNAAGVWGFARTQMVLT